MEGDWFAMPVAQNEGTVHDDSITIRLASVWKSEKVMSFSSPKGGKACPSAFDMTFKSDDISLNLSGLISLH